VQTSVIGSSSCSILNFSVGAHEDRRGGFVIVPEGYSNIMTGYLIM
jgi:hypothetical protein